ncbi:hypothetical protein [Anaerovorax odorimutans]|uniref:hypothetical protein n=1 Tax=Anaerovorax odorimutans TaxID=109327 RepID=UPI0003F89DEE|nr:hypothetical protein [Anaerovorax odorimutans]
MKRHRVPGSCLPNRSGRCLSNICGTSIDSDDLNFTNPQSNLVYMDKVFSYNNDTSCPLLFNLNTGGPHAKCFVTKLETMPQNCCCTPCEINSNSIFNIEKSYVLVEYFNTRPPGNIDACQVTVDGHAVDNVEYFNGQYVASTANLLPNIQKNRCMEEGLPTKTFFLVNNAGPWDLRAKYVLEGTVNTDGNTCCFRIEIANAPTSGNTCLPEGCLSSFAIPDLSIPCSINGTSPNILFQFGANINMVNPRLVVSCRRRPRPNNDCGNPCCDDGCFDCCPDNNYTISLITGLAVEPTIHTEVTRKTLFCVNACEGMLPCDGTLAAEEDEVCEDVRKPDCFCGTNSSVSPITSCGCENNNNFVESDFQFNCCCNRNNSSRCSQNSCVQSQSNSRFNCCNGCSW